MKIVRRDTLVVGLCKEMAEQSQSSCNARLMGAASIGASGDVAVSPVLREEVPTPIQICRIAGNVCLHAGRTCRLLPAATTA